MNIELLIDKYLGMYGNVGAIYTNPTSGDIKNMKSDGIKEVRWIIETESGTIYVWNAENQIHAKVQNMLIDKGVLDSDTHRLEICEYDHPSWICGQGDLGVGKIVLTSKEKAYDYGNREDEIKSSVFSKFFYKKSL